MTLEMKSILVAVASVQLLLSPAEGQIKVFRLTTASQIIEDVTNDAALVSIDNSLRRVVLTADSAAMDYFIHQVDPTESIDSINFSAAPTVAGNTIYRVSVSADHSWSSDVFEPVAIGAASLNSFIGFGEAAPDTNPNAPRERGPNSLTLAPTLAGFE
jgi:hypothetical protein